MSSCFADLQYQSGFGNHFSTEALGGALPEGQNNPQVAPFGLYTEQISGTAFTAPRRDNQRTWLYRIRPSVTHQPFKAHRLDEAEARLGTGLESAKITPNQLRWSPFCMPEAGAAIDFVQGLKTICGHGSTLQKDGLAIHIYTASRSMQNTCFTNSDGEMLIVPQKGWLDLRTEMGDLRVQPGEIVVIPRGVKFQVLIREGSNVRGYVLEIYSGHFQLPELGPLGANGLANARDFLYPKAKFEETSGDFMVINKFGSKLFSCILDHSPFDVVAWHGNLAPYKYDLARFCPVNTVSFDHADPSIFTVLTCPSTVPGVAVADFVIFPPRWNVAENTFRPPYFHRNTMSEFMGLIRGVYDGKSNEFAPGGASLHMCMTPHGPDTTTFTAASTADLKPQKLSKDTLAFMFEFNGIPKVCNWALEASELQDSYYKCWSGLGSNFRKPAMNGVKEHAKQLSTKEKKSLEGAQLQGPA